MKENVEWESVNVDESSLEVIAVKIRVELKIVHHEFASLIPIFSNFFTNVKIDARKLQNLIRFV